MLEGVVHDGLEHQAVPNLGWAPEVEHLNGLQGRMGTAQPAGGGQELGGITSAPRASVTGLSHLLSPVHRPSPEPHALTSVPPIPTQPSDSSAQKNRTKVPFHNLEHCGLCT